jgi:phage baseplate assembly protein W
MDNKSTSIVGVDMHVDPDYLEKVVHETVVAGVSAALNGKDEIVSQLVHDVLSTQVNDQGQTPNYRGEKTQTLLDYLVSKELKSAALEEVQSEVEKARPKLKKAIKEEIKKESVTDSLVEAFLKANIDSGAFDWRCYVNFTKD